MDIFLAWVPLITVLSLWITIGLYFGKKIERHKEQVVVDHSRPDNCLSLVRGIEPTNYLRKYVVIIDDEVIGEIASGETKHFKLASGKYKIRVKVDWCKSNSYEFEIKAGVNTELNCGANYNNWKCMFMWAFKPSNWVYVKVA